MFGMRAKVDERRQARKLREQSRSMPSIANDLGVALSSVSLWTADLRMPPELGEAVAFIEPPPADEQPGRRCGRCKEILPLSEFSRHPEQGHQWWCRRCFREYFKQRGDLHRQQSAAAKRRRKAEARRWVADFLRDEACADCGLRDPLVLEFDHVQEKLSGVSILVSDGWSVDRITREVARCNVVCVNCYRRRTYAREPSWRVDPSALEANPPAA